MLQAECTHLKYLASNVFWICFKLLCYFTDQLKNQLKSELNVTKQLYKSLEENLKKMSEYSSQLENEREMKKKEYLEKDQQLINA